MAYVSVAISAPASAEAGSVVPVSVTVVNTDMERRIFRTVVTADGAQIIWVELPFAAGQSMTFSGSFVMPASNVTILAWVLMWEPLVGIWASVGFASRVVSLAVPATFHLDVHVPPWAPGGGISPGSGDYAAYSTVMLTAHPFSGYQFLGWGGHASGTSLTYSLYMDSDKYVEAYFEPVPVPLAGTITGKWVNKAPEGSHLAIPAAVAADENTFEVGVRGRNDSDISIIAGMEVTVFDPDGIQRAAPAIDWAGLSPGEELNWEYNISRVDKAGIWTTVIRFQAQE